MTNINAEDDGFKRLPANSPPSPRQHNYFAVPFRGQLAGHAYIATPSHVRLPLAQTPSPVPLDDCPSPLAPPSTACTPFPMRGDVTDSLVAVDDDSATQPPDRVAAVDDTANHMAENAFTVPPGDMPSLSWSYFIEKYAEGKWDPSQAPTMPVASPSDTHHLRRKSTSAPTVPGQISSLHRPSITQQHASEPVVHNTPLQPFTTSRAQIPPETSNTSDSQTITRRRGGEQLVLADFEQPAFPDTAQPSTPPQTPPSIVPTPSSRPITPFAVADAATVRWAGARVKVAPLALSSPERELLDPLSDYVIGLPTPQQKAMTEYLASRDPSRVDRRSAVFAPGSSEQNPMWRVNTPQRREDVPRASSRNRQSVDISRSAAVSSPFSGGAVNGAVTPHTRSTPDCFDVPENTSRDAHSTPSSPSPIPPAPLPRKGSGRRTSLRGHPNIPQSPSGGGQIDICSTPGKSVRHEKNQSPTATHAMEQSTLNTPTSSVASSSNPIPTPSKSTPSLAMTSEERLYRERGYFAAPHPPNELGRLTALRKFNILHTAPDVNFDRIAHLAKLVFQTRWVLISLVDKDEQFLKHGSGIHFNASPRDSSFCSHAILQDNEPLVVLNTADDWRFANNPLANTPHQPSDPNYFKISFYAGTPLRTSDGFNVGSLCVIDDVPRTEFNPRQRHTLKEFGAIVMREMELWRDKVQLRVRDRIQTSMEQFTRECLEFDRPTSDPVTLSPEQNMKRVYTDAASLVRRTLDLEAAIVVDVSNFEVWHTTAGEVDSPPSKTYRGDLYKSNVASTSSKIAAFSDDAAEPTSDSCHEYGRIPPLPILGSAENSATPPSGRNEPLSGEAHAKLASFLATYPDGRMYERIVPSCFRGIVPENLQYAMVVPIFNVDGQPFILLFGYTTDRTKHYLEGFEMQYLRAIGVIILSAVLKRRMKLADKAKSLFISNISHELRTPLHGILAAAELLADSGLTSDQRSFLQTIDACGTSLVETVNHVLDFSKLSGTSKSIDIKRTTTDLISLLEDTVEGSWVGARARAVYSSADIGSAYSPPKRRLTSTGTDVSELTQIESSVETVLDIGFREEGWLLKCEKAGIRRILMNLMGNSLKFTDRGFVHISLRELPSESGSSFVRVELGVLDTGKGISKDFLNNRMFQPFSQENPLHTGTGLGLAIVNSIVKSDGIRGKVDVYSTEGAGTEIRVVIETELPSRSSSRLGGEGTGPHTQKSLPTVKVFPTHFDLAHRGQRLLRDVLSSYVVQWWGANITSGLEESNVLLINEDFTVLEDLITRMDTFRPIVLLASKRGDSELSAAVSSFEEIGGLCCVVYKPVRPSHLYHALERAISTPRNEPSRSSSRTPLPAPRRSPVAQRPSLIPSDEASRVTKQNMARGPTNDDIANVESGDGTTHPHLAMRRRYSEEIPGARQRHTHSMTHYPKDDTLHNNSQYASRPYSTSTPNSHRGAQTRKNDVRIPTSTHVLVVEDNDVNRNLLTQWLKKQGFEFEEATDGQAAVDLFSSRPAGHFDVLLVDMSMPVLDGVGAIQMIRNVENQRYGGDNAALKDRNLSPPSTPKRAKILALSGLASKEDKLRAFSAGVDGYLVKPVSFKTLAQVFARLEESDT